jgi:predicted molibdopterin-dependent oxidoreductase YjgC
VLVLLGADPLADFPDADLARRALAGARTVIAVDTLPTASVRQADIVLPAAGWAETDGTTTNIEGRVSRLTRKVTAPGTARADWVIAAELAFRLGDDLGFESVEEIVAELRRISPLHEGLTIEAIGVDGVVLPVDVETPEVESPDPDSGVDPDAADAAVEAAGTDDEGEQQEADAEATEAQADAESEEAHDRPAPEVEQPTPASRPAGLTFTAPRVDIPQPDGYKLRLVTTRSLYDLGATTQAAASLAGLAPGAVLRLHPNDFDRLGVAAGTAVTVSNREGGRGAITVPVQPSLEVPRGAAHVSFLQPGGSAADLIAADRSVTDVRVEVSP